MTTPINQMISVGVQFPMSNSIYTYRAPREWGLQRNDIVVVLSPTNGYTCCKVVRVLDYLTLEATKRIVSKVDVSDYNEYLETREAPYNSISSELEELRRGMTTYQATMNNRIRNLFERLSQL